MKLFLRYQLTGSVFIGWFVVLYYGGQSADFEALIIKLATLKTDKAFISLFAAYPIGVIIHQFSVLLKNLIFARYFPALSDKPLLFNSTKACNKAKQEIDFELYEYYMDKISNLNTFYYVRFDNGFLSPILSILFYKLVSFQNITHPETLLKIKLLFVLVSVITLFYIFKIIKELRSYYAEINSSSCQSAKTCSFRGDAMDCAAIALFVLVIVVAV